MPAQTVKAAKLKTPDGVEFWAIIDTIGEIKNESEAFDVSDHASSLFGIPVVVAFRSEFEGWQTYGNVQCAKFLSSLPPDKIVLTDVLLTSGKTKPDQN